MIMPLMGIALLIWIAWTWGVWVAVGVAILGTIIGSLLARALEEFSWEWRWVAPAILLAALVLYTAWQHPFQP